MCITEHDEARTFAEQKAEGRAEGKKEGKEEEFDLALALDILRCIKENKLTLNQIAEKFRVSLEKVEILATIA